MKITDKQKRILEILSTAKSDKEVEERIFRELGERPIVERNLQTSCGAPGKPEPIK